jgi:hypothetical protein
MRASHLKKFKSHEFTVHLFIGIESVYPGEFPCMSRLSESYAFRARLKGAPRRGTGVLAPLEGADFGSRAQKRLGETVKGEEGLHDQI